MKDHFQLKQRQPFHSQEWPISNFSLQYQYIFKQTGGEIKEKIN